MYKKTKLNRDGFTLVEMLVVIAIIGILAAILVPTLFAVLERAKRTRITTELALLHKAIESYKQDCQDYPPDFSNGSVVVRHLRKTFPRHNEVRFVTNASGQQFKIDAVQDLVDANITPSEAIVFWLSQLGNDPRQPLTGQNAKPKDMYTFDEARRIPTRIIKVGRLRDLSGANPQAGSGNDLQLYEYVAKDGNEAPYVYFDSRSYKTASYPRPAAGATIDAVRPYLRRVGTETQPNLKFANKDTFQILSAGLDGEFGIVSVTNTGGVISAVETKVFATGEDDASSTDTVAIAPYDPGDLDNIANFSDGRTLEDHME